MGDYFRHARAIDRSLRWALRAAPAADRPRIWCGRPTASASSTAARRPSVRRRGWRCFRRRSTAAARSPTTRCRASSRTPAASRAEEFFPTPTHRDALLHFLKPRPGLVRAAVGDARLRAARADDSRVQGDQLPRGPRLLPQVHGRRAHAADDPQPRAADRSARPERERFARLLGELEAPELLVLALLLPRRRQVDATTTTPPRARGWRGRCSSGSHLDEESRDDRRVPGRRST